MRAPDLRRPAVRLSLLRGALCLGLLAVAARAAHLSLDERAAEHGQRQVVTEVRLPAERGDVLDRRGQRLAVTVKAPSVYAVPGAVEDVDATARALAGALDAEPARVADRLRRGRSFSYVARWVSEEQARAVRALGLPGIGLVEEPRRVHPYGPFAAHLVGFSNIDGIGVRGIEEQEDAWLRGHVRRVPVERDARGRLLLTEAIDPRATVGGSVTLTLDAAFQADAETALAEAVARTGARSGFVLSLDPRSGEVLALAEHPTFDPNRFRETSYPETRARALLDAYEPGSTFKVFLMAAALEAGVVSPSDVFDCEHGRFKVPGKVIRDAHPYGELDLQHVLWKSSNIGATKIAYRLGAAPYHDMLKALGFGSATGSGFPQESAGLLRSWQGWRTVDHANIAFGQGVNVTALQLASATAAIANRGVWVQPRLVLSRTTADGEVRPADPGERRRVMRPEVADLTLSMMEGVVGPQGTGKRAAIPGIRVGGKTGTAQKLDPRTRSYSDSRYQAWFIGVAPVDDPRLVVVVMLDEPRRGTHTGGVAAAPVFARVAEAQLARLGIYGRPELPPTMKAAAPEPVAPVAEVASPVEAAEESEGIVQLGHRVLVPDFSDRTVDEVRQAATGVLDVVVRGEGRAVAQEPPPGTILDGRAGRVFVRFARGPGEG